MKNIIGVQFEKYDPISYFVVGEEMRIGDRVLCETLNGLDVARVIQLNVDEEKKEIKPPIRQIIRKINSEDELILEANKKEEKKAFDICFKAIQRHRLPMKLIKTKYVFDRRKLLFYFYSDDRVDFRNLVKDLANEFKTRIELRQIGVREESKMLGAIGDCGRKLCCSSGISCNMVSIKMAKDQGISLNPSSISGICGRLMCCLSYENEVYEELKRTMPKIGMKIKSKYDDLEKGEIVALNPLTKKVRVQLENASYMNQMKEFAICDIEILEDAKIK